MLALGACFESSSPIGPSETTPTDDGGTSSTTAFGSTDEGFSTETTALDSTSTTAGTDTVSMEDTTAESSTSSGGSPHRSCPAGTLDARFFPSTVEADTTEQIDELAGSCGGGSAPEITYTFTAPRTAEYIFETAGSAIDTVLYILEGECEGPELRCDDDGFAGENASLVSLPLLEGQTVTAVVDAFGVEGGPIQLTVRPGSVACPAQSFGLGLPQTLVDQTNVATDYFETSCGTEDEGDQAFLFIAPQDGIYRFDTEGSEFDTTLALLDGACGGPSLACNVDEPNTFDGHSAFGVPLLGGQVVTAVVEGYFGATGQLELSVDRLPGTCPDEDLGAQPIPFAVMGSTAATEEASAGSCGGLGSPDYAYLWTAPTDAVYRFDTAGSTFDTVVYLLEDGCLGDELVCNDDASGPSAALSAYLHLGQTVVIVVDGAFQEGDFTLTVEETTDSGDCCAPHMSPGCGDETVQTCVCTLDAFCCTTEWDPTCVDEATVSCDAICL